MIGTASRTMLARIPPHNLDAERAVLGALLLEDHNYDRVIKELRPSDFYTEAHRTIYNTMLRLFEHAEPVDLITLSEELQRTGGLTTAGGPAALALLVEHAAIATHLTAYVGIVRDMAVRRELIQASMQITNQAFDPKDDVRALVESAERKIVDLAHRSAAAAPTFAARPLHELFDLMLPDPGFLLDKWIPEAALSFVVGDSETYKSWFCLYLACCIASGREMFDRFPVRQSPVLIVSEENGEAEDKRRADLLVRGMNFNRMLPLYIASDTGFSFDDPNTYAALRAYIQAQGIRLVIVDSFVRVHRHQEKDASEMNALYLDRIKPVLLDGVSIVALHHKRKMPAGQHPPASDTDDIRGSGDLRAAAHTVLFLRSASETQVIVRHNKARGWKKQEAYVFGLRDCDRGGVMLTYEGAPEHVLDRSDACRMAILEFVQARGSCFRQEVLEALKGKFSRRVIDPMLKALGAKNYPLKVDALHGPNGTKKLFTFVSTEGDDQRDFGNEEIPF